MSSVPEILTIGEMIDSAFGDPETNVVHHKLIHAVLFLLARQLRVLDRRVKIELFNNPDFYSSGSSLSVTEVKIQANIKKKRRSTRGTSIAGRGKEGPTERGGPSDKGGRSERVGPSEKGGRSEKVGPTGKGGRSEKGGTESPPKLAEIIEEYAKGNVSIADIKTRSLKSETATTKERDGTGTRIGFTDEDQLSAVGSKSDKTTSESYSDKTSSMEKSSSPDKTTELSSTDKTQSSTDKSSTQKSSTDKSTTDKSLTDKSTTDKSTTDKSTTDKSTTDKSTTDKSTTDKSTTDRSTTDRSTTDKSSTDKSTTDKSTTDKSTTEESPKSYSDKTTSMSADKTSTGISSSDKTATEKTTTSSSKRTTSSSLPDKRADSREEHEKTPTPMASMDSMEVQYEKLLVVERLPSDEAKARVGRLQGEQRGPTPRLSIVTQEEFLKLASDVRQLQSKFDPVGTANFPENAQLMQELRKGASLTDAMAALQLSARLEAAEKALTRMTTLVTDLASKHSDIDVTTLLHQGEPDTEVLYHGPSGPSSQMPPPVSTKSAAFKQPLKPQKSKQIQKKRASQESVLDTISVPTMSIVSEKGEVTAVEEEEETGFMNWITYEDLDTALQEVMDNVMSAVSGIVNKSKTNADAALKIATRLDSKFDASLDLSTKMTDLETLVADYAEKVNTLDTGLSSQMTNYQEQLTQMQHDLETGLENMAEALANAGGDTTAITELNTYFTNLQLDFETTNSRQNELKDIQTTLRSQLDDLQNQIEILRDTKSDRDEVTDALRDKVGLGTLNGLISLAQFDAVRGDLEQRIGAAYDKFNNQEIVWQKAIDDLLRELGEKADWTQIVFLREDIQNNIRKLKNRLQAMLDIVGEPQAAVVSRKLHRDTMCLSCSTPAHLDIEANTLPELPSMPGTRPPTLGAESPHKHKEDDHGHGTCYPNLPIPHPKEPRAHVCQRYCGGSHTKIPATLSRSPPGLVISSAVAKEADTKSTEKNIKKPCIPCNVKPKLTKDKLEDKQKRISEDAEEKEDKDNDGSDMTPEDFVRLTSLKTVESKDAAGVTPPIPMNEDL